MTQHTDAIWAKTGVGDGDNTYPLARHLIDTGRAAAGLLALRPDQCLWLATATGLDDPASAVALFVALHDLGKACPAFQAKHAPTVDTLTGLGFTFPRALGPIYHATVTSLTLPAILVAWGMGRGDATDVAQAIGGHHGAWPTTADLRRHRIMLGDAAWDAARIAIANEVAAALPAVLPTQLGRTDAERDATLLFLAGLCTVADWVASGAPGEDMAVRLAAIGFTPRLGAAPATFDAMFGFDLHPLQAAALEVAPVGNGPHLVIVEAPTGTGKTELALTLADRWDAPIYVAMPTQATSNQMWQRVGRFLQNRYPDANLAYQLTHSGARHIQTLDNLPIGARGWFLPSKRGLLAQYAVGTIDQALLAALQVRHVFVRSFGLAGRTVICDEVHAYDTYMNQLFTRLLTHLRSLGSNVVILSATLPAVTRQALVTAWGGDVAPPVAYPRVTVVTGDRTTATALPAGAERTVALRWLDRDPGALAEAARDLVADGGCVAVICNTVGRAQAVYRALNDPDASLLHARTLPMWRREDEARVLGQMGRTGDRPARAIVVATQVLEQSLDLDFDAMISDLAPIDLLIQRAGRLHRHDRPRPAHLTGPVLHVAAPAPDYRPDSYIYARPILAATQTTLAGLGALHLPEATARLIDSVYTPANIAGDDANRAVFAAHRRLLPAPGDDVIWSTADLDDEDPSLGPLIRLGRPSVSLVCADTDTDTDLTSVAALLDRTISVSHFAIYHHYIALPTPDAWTDDPTLQHYRLAVFTDGCAVAGGYELTLTRALGLEIASTPHNPH